ncbi:MAG: translation initiation factor IF-2 [Patescibacteria group bacterium]
MNISELARRLKITTNELKEKLPSLGFDIGLKAIQIPDEQAEKAMVKWREMETLEKLRAKFTAKSEAQQTQEQEEKIEDKNIINLSKIITVSRLAEQLKISVVKLIHELIKNGVMASINDNLDFEIAAIVVEHFGYQAVLKEGGGEDKSISHKEKLESLLGVIDKDNKNLFLRPPVVVVLGHVDHGKTSLLDAIRETNVAAKEAGAITQHIGAYQVSIKVKNEERLITFIDTPGHAAFNEMRSRGGQIADIAVLVIAADDKVQPQTIESIKVIQEAGLPFIVAINKIDKPDADIDRVKKGLAEINLAPEDWGGKTICVPVSARAKQGINDLLEMIVLVSDMEKDKLMCEINRPAVGTVIESHLDKGEGRVATILIQAGILHNHDYVFFNRVYGRVRTMKNHQGELIESAGPGAPVQISGLKSVPVVGEIMEVVNNSKEIKTRSKLLERQGYKRMSIDETSADKEKQEAVFNVVIRADVLGSLEAVVKALTDLSTPEIKIEIVKRGLGDINESDAERANVSNAWLVGFNVGISSAAAKLADTVDLTPKTFKVIYELIDEVKAEMNKLVKPEIKEVYLGKIEVLALFKKGGNQIILGGRVIEGEVEKGVKVRIWRQGQLMGEGRLVQLQVNKLDVQNARAGCECGMRIDSRVSLEIGDQLEFYREEKIIKKIFEI